MTDSGLGINVSPGEPKKTQMHKPARGKANCTEEYKQQALGLLRQSGRNAAKMAAELGSRPSRGRARRRSDLARVQRAGDLRP